MAQFYFDMDSEVEGEYPAALTPYGSTTQTREMRTDPERGFSFPEFNLHFEQENTGGTASHTSIHALVDDASDEVEVACLMQPNYSRAWNLGPMLFGAEQGDAYGAFASRGGFDDGEIELARLDEFETVSVASNTLGEPRIDEYAPIWFRMRGNRATGEVKLKYWRVLEDGEFQDGADNEPDSWLIEWTDPSFLAGTLHGFYIHSRRNVYGFVLGVGTDGDSAPTSLSDMPDTPTNLQTVDITDTSARLVWDAPT